MSALCIQIYDLLQMYTCNQWKQPNADIECTQSLNEALFYDIRFLCFLAWHLVVMSDRYIDGQLVYLKSAKYDQ